MGSNSLRGPIPYGPSSQTQCRGSGLQRVYQLEMSEAPVADLSSLDTGHGANGRVVYKVVLTGGIVKNTDHDGSVAAKKNYTEPHFVLLQVPAQVRPPLWPD